MSRYITGLNRTSELKGNAVCIFYEPPFSIWSYSKYYNTQSDVRVKSCCRLNLIRASVFNLERLDVLHDSVRHPTKKLLSFEFARTSVFNFERLDILRDSIGHPS